MATTLTNEALETGLLISDSISDSGLKFIRNVDPDLFRAILKKRGINPNKFDRTSEIRQRVKRRKSRRKR